MKLKMDREIPDCGAEYIIKMMTDRHIARKSFLSMAQLTFKVVSAAILINNI